jgi:hypothetical protein
MKNLRVYILSKEEQANFDPDKFTENLKAAGFEFDSTVCPIKIKQPWDRITAYDCTMYRQWELDKETLQ